MDLLLQPSVFTRIGNIHAAAEYTDRGAANSQRSFVCRTVDSSCEATDDGDSTPCQILGQLHGGTPPVTTATPRTDDGNRRRL